MVGSPTSHVPLVLTSRKQEPCSPPNDFFRTYFGDACATSQLVVETLADFLLLCGARPGQEEIPYIVNGRLPKFAV